MFFNKKKKEEKAKAQEREQVTKIIQGASAQNPTLDDKKNQKYVMANVQQANKQKEALMDSLMELKREFNRNEGFEVYDEDVHDLIMKVRTGRNLSNSSVQFAVDNFITKKVNECFNYCNRGSSLGAFITLESIKGLIQDRNDMASDLSKYCSPQYLQVRAQHDQYLIEQQVLDAQITDLNKQKEALKLRAHEKGHEHEIGAIMNRVKAIVSDIEMKQKNSTVLGDRIVALNTTLRSIEANISKEEIKGMDMSVTDIMGNVINENEEQKIKDEMFEDMSNELNSSLRNSHVSSQSITVGADTLESKTSTENLLDELDKM